MVPEKHRRTFLSYSRNDKEFALKLAKELKSAGFPVWIDQLDIPTGARWDDELEKALMECSIFLVILTPDSTASENVKDEIGFAIDNGKRILPILLENARVPLRLRRFQYVDFTTKSYEDGVESAKKLLRNLTDNPTEPIPILPRATGAIPESRPNLTNERSAMPMPVQKKLSAKVLIIGFGAIGFIGIIIGIISVTLLWSKYFRENPTAPAIEPSQVALSTNLPVSTQVIDPPTSVPSPMQMEVQPTNTPKPTAVPDTPTPGIQKYFTEDFDGELKNWEVFIADARKEEPVITTELSDDFNISAEDGRYLFDIQRRLLYAYSIYDLFEYADVRIDVRIDSQNVNANNARLVCRYSEKDGWYEFRIASNGLYSIYFVKPNPYGLITYRTIADGGSNNVNSGNAINEYSIICQGNTLSLFINGELAKKTSDDLSVLRTGKIGVSVSSINSLPVIVGYDWVQISEP